jgi:DNA-binding NtrC family response regulator
MIELFADRFVITRGGLAFDLASGEDVTLVTSTPGGPTDEKRWAARCDRLFSARHRALAELVDFGAAGEHRRFEAWRCGPPWRGSQVEGRRALDLARTFLAANGLTAAGCDEGSVRSQRADPVVLPDHAAGYPEDARGRAPSPDLPACGIRIVDRDAARGIAELLAEPASGPRFVSLGAPPGGGLRTALSGLARIARRQGLVPVSLTVLQQGVRGLLVDRSLLIIADNRRQPEGWRGFLDWMVRSPRAHVLLFAGSEEVRGIHSLWLDRLPPDTLVDAILPPAGDGASRTQIGAAARRARGLPGRFASLLWWRTPLPLPRQSPGPATRAAERPASYGAIDAPVGDASSAPVPLVWPDPGEVAALKRRLQSAVSLTRAGRHAPGERALRAIVASLARRHEWAEASAGSLALATSLLRRGRAQEAQDVLSDASDQCRKVGLLGRLMEVAVVSGAAWLDQGRLDEAERVLMASLTAAGSCQEPGRTTASRLGLARLLFWRGRYDEAVRMLAPLDTGASGEAATAVRTSLMCSRVAIGTSDLEAGLTRAADALAAATRTGDPRLVALAACGLAFAHLANGDRDAVDRDVGVCLNAARAARDPLCALRARLLAAESDRRAGRPGRARALVTRLARLPSGRLPSTVRARLALLSDLLDAAPRGKTVDTVKRHCAATGLGALALYAPRQVAERSDVHLMSTDVVEILRLCQTMEDDHAVLTSLCGLVRTRLRASSAGFFVRDRGALVPLASDGGHRLEAALAARAIDAGQVIAPHLRNGGIEGGAPVRAGGDTIGALVGRWTLGSPHDLERAALVLASAATAAGPALAALLARRAQPAIRGTEELAGISAAMAEVQRSIDRAAASPFAVLVEGESGSGKELVARALHRRSPRRDRPFCTLNCAALPDDLVEAELFGHARGAFTGAVVDRPGVFEDAHTGTLFLDEIGELSARAQAKILRTIQEGELRRVGENASRRIDVRIVSATNRDLRGEVAAGRFRLDLLYRLDVVRIAVPPLRARREDIAVLVDRFWREAADRIGSRSVLGAATVAALARYDWPGNVRELQNVLAALAVRAPRRGVVQPSALPPTFGAAAPADSWRLDTARRIFEERFVRAALVRTGGHRARAADELGVTRQGLAKLIARLGISDIGDESRPTAD